MRYNDLVGIKKQKLKTKNILIGSGVLFFIIFSIFSFKSQNNSVPHQNLVDTKIYQYSDKKITQNAITTNPEFRSIAFEPIKDSFDRQLAAVVKSIKTFLVLSEEKDLEMEYGSWVWTPVEYYTPEYLETLLGEAKANHINVIYASIDSYLDIFVMKKGAERDRQKKIFADKLEDFIKRANKKGIAVDAEAGWRNWAEEGNEYKPFAIANFVKNFNETRQYKFRGFQYDVEPYLLDEYKTEPEKVLEHFVSLIDKSESFLGSSDLQFSVVIPDFYDGKDGLTSKFSYLGKKDFVIPHLLEILDRRAKSSLILMSYRSFADGYDGSIEISQNEMQTVENGNYKTRVIIAQETGDVPPPYITFYKTSKNHLSKQINRIEETFGSYPNFGGIAIHYLNALLVLK